ncbi:LLM class flavin-dependent oxidoreductase [Cupriavidus sp. CV2]|uniref:LLM class flavin-dependent oxidoreductase n=1 Tax=Cupriavidus ulmosensis TaxID=3065913 RepID=UPI00296B116C|nr:LLM class flavin-dependent oxidoreductase [Cupriavidus sp. CV2]MDW3685076.1 LLM class flavin-dependent oxidoreductase [Cupriavidus sp. CV2]
MRPTSTVRCWSTITWAAGLLAQTKNLTVFATIHTAANHPAMVAKRIATLDQIGQGRAGLKDIYGLPKPCHGERPPILNAAGSGKGRDLAIQNANFLFTPEIDPARTKVEVAELKAKATGRRLEWVHPAGAPKLRHPESGGNHIDSATYAPVA